MTDVFIVGVGQTKFKEFFDRSVESLASEALSLAINDAKVERKEIQTIYIGSMVTNGLAQSSIVGACGRNCSMNTNRIRVEAGNASGSAAFHQAYLAIKAGVYDCVAVLGVDKLSDYVKSSMIEKINAASIDYQWEYEMGATLTSLFAFITQAHMRNYGTTLEQLAAVLEKNHKNGVLNPRAQYRRAIRAEDFLKAKRIADPIGRFDIATQCDGAATLILASEKCIKNRNIKGEKVKVLASAVASDTLALMHRKTLTELTSTKKAAKQLYDITGLSPSDIHIAEVHDSYPIGEILAIEDLGFFKKGDGGKASLEGLTQLNSEISVNPSGGIKSRGNPYGATGIAQIVEVNDQLLLKAGERQVKDCKYAITQNIMGTGVISYVNAFTMEEV